ncbi:MULTISPECIES: type 1 glutamine amidotransferase [unclassified Tolypothrix]|uniref:type 1 glutamine amidotransferase n=1 Tax=unclassified Tolypothrix TaxID=2649714 RepID=UPI0005EAA2E9|nr:MULTISPECIES: type 1 glutamine amidotransferase [unclassified Tolypothrix]BAY91269.1 glutamine amidotransferase, class I [Microchaete diplosiphon NIES-3275]EKF04205.1 class I glutamine amidotransferase [Tolypothrix sp. PCC 7601]MBE9080909.1 type 1 glutamine amidotransferase [Tolypothrix sp. LEGE 11397]UYD25343.1 type 1 glutamine amidotransferase [Tolypothrix sp. PCC 7712]UYD32413.1 type 1 glutamine amidotransferase [Tolypothrix sp. PCC 7601]
MRIHCLQHVPFEGLASIAQWATQQGHIISATQFYNGDNLPSVDDLDWLIVMGGPMNIYEYDQYPWLKTEKDFIEAAIQKNKVVIGICLGSQLIADVLGSKVYQGREKEIGWYPITLTPEAHNYSVFASFPQSFNVFHWHGDTFDLPPGAVRIAYSEVCANQAFIYGDQVLGLQFHLESTKESVSQIIENCAAELVSGKYIQKAEEMLARDDDFSKINTFMCQILDYFAISTN